MLIYTHYDPIMKELLNIVSQQGPELGIAMGKPQVFTGK